MTFCILRQLFRSSDGKHAETEGDSKTPGDDQTEMGGDSEPREMSEMSRRKEEERSLLKMFPFIF